MKSVLALGCAVLCAALCAAAPPQVQDQALKAAFLVRFVDFVAWPPGTAGNNFNVCLSASHDFGTAVHEATRGTSVRGRTVVVRHLANTDPVNDCQVLFIAGADTHLLPLTRRRPILTVGEAVGFCQRGGVINLRTVDHRVRFEVSLLHARDGGLVIDPQLLRLAVAVHGGGQ